MQHLGTSDAGTQDDAQNDAQDDTPTGASLSPSPRASSPGMDGTPLPAGADELRSRAGQDAAERASDPPSRALALKAGKPDAPASPTATVQATGDQGINGVLGDTKWSGTDPISFSFPADPGIYGPDSLEARNNFARVSDAVIQAASHVLAGSSAVASDRAFLAGMAVSDITNLEFTDAGSGNADIRYGESSTPAAAYAYYPGPNPGDGDVWVNGTVFAGTSTDLRTPELGGYGYTVVLHELLHALGLKHTNEAGGPANVVVPHEMDSTEFSVMSFRSYVGAPPEGGITNERWGFPQSPMMLDIAGLQALYGADYGYRSGATVYSWNPSTGEMSVDGVGQGVPGGGAEGANQVYLTIWDGGGDDTYDMAAFGGGVRIDLQPGGWSITSEEQRAYIGGGQHARGTVFNALEHRDNPASLIENATGGAGSDVLAGNSVRNTLTGNKGNDTLTGGAGGDTFVMAPGDGQDLVTDFASGSDKLVLHGVAASAVTQAAATREGSSGLLVAYGTDSGVFLRGVSSLADGDVVLDGGPLATRAPTPAKPALSHTAEDGRTLQGPSQIPADVSDPGDAARITTDSLGLSGTNGFLAFDPAPRRLPSAADGFIVPTRVGTAGADDAHGSKPGSGSTLDFRQVLAQAELDLGADLSKPGGDVQVTASGRDAALFSNPDGAASSSGNALAVLHGAGANTTLAALAGDGALRVG